MSSRPRKTTDSERPEAVLTSEGCIGGRNARCGKCRHHALLRTAKPRLPHALVPGGARAPLSAGAVDLNKGDHKRPYFLAINPMGKVPTLIDQGIPIAETGAMLVHLADKYAPGELAPLFKEPSRADYLRWLFFAAGVMEPAFGEKFFKWQDVPARRAAWGDFASMEKTVTAGVQPGPLAHRRPVHRRRRLCRLEPALGRSVGPLPEGGRRRRLRRPLRRAPGAETRAADGGGIYQRRRQELRLRRGRVAQSSPRLGRRCPRMRGPPNFLMLRSERSEPRSTQHRNPTPSGASFEAMPTMSACTSG